MKTKYFQVILILAFFSACKSKEEKANELIKEQMFKTLYDFSSYEPIETKIDSAFSSIYKDSVILGYAVRASANLELTNEYIEKAKDAQSIMEIWSGGFSSYSISKYYEAEKEFEENFEIAKIHLDKTTKYSDSIKNASKNFVKEFIGWQGTHLFRAKTKGGQPDIATYIFIFDPEIVKIIHSEDTKDESNEKIRGLIDEAIKGNLID
jgi:hypothetical protein